jgi:hypothetical protein
VAVRVTYIAQQCTRNMLYFGAMLLMFLSLFFLVKQNCTHIYKSYKYVTYLICFPPRTLPVLREKEDIGQANTLMNSVPLYLCTYSSYTVCKGKGKGHPITGHEGPTAGVEV